MQKKRMIETGHRVRRQGESYRNVFLPCPCYAKFQMNMAYGINTHCSIAINTAVVVVLATASQYIQYKKPQKSDINNSNRGAKSPRNLPSYGASKVWSGAHASGAWRHLWI